METTNNHEPSRPNPLNDFLFLKVMGEKDDEPQLIGFLNAVLGRSGKEPMESLAIKENKMFVKAVLKRAPADIKRYDKSLHDIRSACLLYLRYNVAYLLGFAFLGDERRAG
jgi:hypothetical protein